MRLGLGARRGVRKPLLLCYTPINPPPPPALFPSPTMRLSNNPQVLSIHYQWLAKEMNKDETSKKATAPVLDVCLYFRLSQSVCVCALEFRIYA